MFENLSAIEIVGLIFAWWLIGFIPGIWTASAARRNFNRWAKYKRPLMWSDLWLPIWFSILGPISALVHILVAIIFECGERHWFDFMDRPIFTQKDK